MSDRIRTTVVIKIFENHSIHHFVFGNPATKLDTYGRLLKVRNLVLSVLASNSTMMEFANLLESDLVTISAFNL